MGHLGGPVGPSIPGPQHITHPFLTLLRPTKKQETFQEIKKETIKWKITLGSSIVVILKSYPPKKKKGSTQLQTLNLFLCFKDLPVSSPLD